VRYSTMEKDTASQNGHFTLVDLSPPLTSIFSLLVLEKIEVVLFFLVMEEVGGRTDL
jgi:hypothetical protein